MRIVFVALTAAFPMLTSSVALAGDPVAECKDFFAKFEKCVNALQGEKQQSARIYMKTIRGTLGLSDDLNQGDPMYLGIMCGGMMQEVKKDPDVQSYNCKW